MISLVFFCTGALYNRLSVLFKMALYQINYEKKYGEDDSQPIHGNLSIDARGFAEASSKALPLLKTLSDPTGGKKMWNIKITSSMEEQHYLMKNGKWLVDPKTGFDRRKKKSLSDILGGGFDAGPNRRAD